MQRRRIVVAAAMVTAAGAAVAFTLPSMAGVTPSGQRTATADSGAPKVLRAMQRDLGVSGDQAAARLKKEQWASKVTSALRARTGSTFAGSWMNSDGTALTVAVTDAAMADEVRATGAQAKVVDRSEADLDKAKQRLDAAATKADRQLPGWYVDAASNKLVVLAKPGDTGRAERFAADAGVAADSVKVLTSSSTPRTLADVRGADPYFINLEGGTARCSIGFSVKGGFVTAGHCGTPGTATKDFNQQAQGVVKASTFPGNGDFGFVETNANANPRPVVNDFAGNELPVAGNTEAQVGASICRSGSTTGTHCGVILAKNQTVNYPEGAVTGLTRTDVCAEGGDSGGPWLAGDQAQGVTSGGSGDCTQGGETFFQPINEILAANNLTLLTTGNAGGDQPPASQPPASEPPASQPPADNGGDNNGNGGNNGDGNGAGNGDDQAVDCASLPVVRQGALRARSAQAQPNGGAFRAAAGLQSACLNAADGVDFDLFLQRLAGGRFKTVASATGTGDKALTFNGRAGTYRYVVAATAGSGAYALGFATP
jgi:streptogrisin C